MYTFKLCTNMHKRDDMQKSVRISKYQTVYAHAILHFTQLVNRALRVYLNA